MAARLAVNVPIAVALVFLILLQLGIIQTFRVSSINMSPTLALDDHVLVRAYGREPARGDVVVYRSPFDYDHLQLGRIVALEGDHVELGKEGLHLDGRPVATPPSCNAPACGPKESSLDGPKESLLDGQKESPLDGPKESLLDGQKESPLDGRKQSLLAAETVGDHTFFTRRADGLGALLFPRTMVPNGHVFVLSDNRVDERDSRIYGAIPHGAIVGVLSFVYYAFDETGIRWDRMSRPLS